MGRDLGPINGRTMYDIDELSSLNRYMRNLKYLKTDFYRQRQENRLTKVILGSVMYTAYTYLLVAQAVRSLLGSLACSAARSVGIEKDPGSRLFA